MQLLNLTPNRLSLEFAADEWPLVSRRLQRFGILEREQFVTIDQISVGSESFVFSEEDGDLALISQTAGGDLILKRVFRGLSVGFSASALRRSFRDRRVQRPMNLRRAA